MSAHWKPLIRTIVDDPEYYSSIIIPLYCIITDYQRENRDQIVSEERLTDIERCVCVADPEWALEEIKGSKRCDRCNRVFVSDDLYPIPKTNPKYISCEGCFHLVRLVWADEIKMEHESDSENNSVKSSDEECSDLDDNDGSSRG